jgi:hypothetical protein
VLIHYTDTLIHSDRKKQPTAQRTAASNQQAETARNGPVVLEVIIQGSVVADAAQHIAKHYKLPPKLIEGMMMNCSHYTVLLLLLYSLLLFDRSHRREEEEQRRSR